eukprot:4396741-Alexandrium_andersonii.AAC.1
MPRASRSRASSPFPGRRSALSLRPGPGAGRAATLGRGGRGTPRSGRELRSRSPPSAPQRGRGP